MKQKEKVLKVAYLIVFFGLFILSLSFVSAADLSYITDRAIEGIKAVWVPVFSAMFGTYQTDEFLFTKILLFVLLFLGVRAGVKATPALGEKDSISNIISLVVALIAIRFLSENDIVRGLLLPYQVLGVAILVGLVFVLYFFFVEKTVKGGGARKFMWFLFVIIMAILWFSQRDKLSGITNYIYWGALALGIIMFFFDKQFRIYFDRQATYGTALHAINRHLGQLYADYNNAMNVPGDQGEKMRKDIMKQIKKLEEEKHKLS